MKPLKILYTEAATGYGGQERYMHRLMRQMRVAGHEVHALCQSDARLRQYLEAEGFTVHLFSMDSGSDFWRNLLALRRLMQEQHYDVVNTNSRRDTIHAGVAARLAGVPLVVRTRHLARPVGSLLSYRWVPHRVIAVSEFVRQQIIQRGMPAEAIDVVYPAVALPDPLPKQRLRHMLNLSTDDILVGSIAVLRKEKGMQELIQAMAPIIRARTDVHLVIIGGGALQTQLEQFAQQLDADAQVHFLGEQQDISELIGDLDIFALATYLEASGTVFAEAAAAKLPTIGTQVGGVPEMLLPGQSGMLVPLHDIVALRQALQRLIDQPELRKQMGLAGYDYAVTEQRFSLITMQKKTEACYRRWLEQRQ